MADEQAGGSRPVPVGRAPAGRDCELPGDGGPAPKGRGGVSASRDEDGGRSTFADVPVGEIAEITPAREVARAAMNRAKAAARAKGLRPGQPVRRRAAPELSGARSGGRDPQLLGDVLTRLVNERGWTDEFSVGALTARWADVVGATVAEHCVPEEFEAGALLVRADSTAWATQMQLFAPRLLERLAQEVGEGVVHKVTVLGPVGRGFGRGRLSVRGGRGARDTWG